MSIRTGFALAIVGLLAGCADDATGVGFGEMGGEPSSGPQGTTTEFEMTNLEPLPIYRGSTPETPTPALALSFRNTELRAANANLMTTVESRTYGMRQVVLNGQNYVIAEGAAPVASLPTNIRARTGCLVLPGELRSGDAAVYTLDCS